MFSTACWPLLVPADRRLRCTGHVGDRNEGRRDADAEALIFKLPNCVLKPKDERLTTC